MFAMRLRYIFIVSFIILCMAGTSAFEGKTIVAHRGAVDYETENTLEAFKKAIELNAKVIEFDVQKTADDKLIVLHDYKIKRQKVSKSEYNYIEENTDFHVPLLEEVLKLLKGKVKIDVDLRSDGYEDDAVELTLKYFNKSNVTISSRNPDALREIKGKYGVKTILVLGDTNMKKLKLFLGIFPKKDIEKSQADYIAVYKIFVRKGLLEKAEKMEKPVYVWGINGQGKILNNSKIDGLIVKNIENYR